MGTRELEKFLSGTRKITNLSKYRVVVRKISLQSK